MPTIISTPSEKEALAALLAKTSITPELRLRMHQRAIELVERIRADSDPGMMELFLSEYGLSSDEGVALMCLAEALLRVPDGDTMDALIEDKIAPSEWGQHLGHSSSSLVNASTWALYVTGKVLDERDQGSVAGVLRGAIKRLGEPVIRQAVSRVMKEMGRQFVLGETIEKAMTRARNREKRGFTYSYDMLGEAARTEKDARRYHLAYSDAIGELAKAAGSDDIRENPGISIKLSALHPRYETLQRDRVMNELVPRAYALATLAKAAGIGLNIDAEEAGRLEISLDVIEAVLSKPEFKDWEGFGVVVQAYGLRAPKVIEMLHDLAERHDRRIMVRLVKGAYWDTEIKHAQVEGYGGFPVFTRKASTDVSYICCAEELLKKCDRIYPQFATHNAHTVAAVLELASALGIERDQFEFQRLHGMGEALHETVLRRQNTRCRIYAPVGAHKDLLAYLVRRLLENGANSSFVNQIVDHAVSPAVVAADPFEQVEIWKETPENPVTTMPEKLFGTERENSRGWNVEDVATVQSLEQGIAAYDGATWTSARGSGETVAVISPADHSAVGTVAFCTMGDVAKACNSVRDWSSASTRERGEILRRCAHLYEENAHEIFALLMREAGKSLIDCIGELREAVDFLRYYARQAEALSPEPAGVFACISPWNFPLAIFTGQISAALAAGNGVLAKPAEQTCLIAEFAVSLMRQAGVPEDRLFLLPGTGVTVGEALTSNPRVNGVCFTGSTATAQRINRSMANHLAPTAPLIAETGGLNAMIVDSTALPEQAVRDVVASAFQSAGQRCSALRVLYIQEDVADGFLRMLKGAMDELKVGNTRDFASDVGPIIDKPAFDKIANYVAKAKAGGQLLHQISAPEKGYFIPPTALKVNGIQDLAEEIFGPVLHVATFKAQQIDEVIASINNKGYGLTFGLHTRIDDRVQHIVDRIEAGNIYVNRNQIGAVVGSQPFGGEGLSGTGPKAGGPRYLHRFCKIKPTSGTTVEDGSLTAAEINKAFSKLKRNPAEMPQVQEMPGPTGESNRLSLHPRDRILCLGPGAQRAAEQAQKARKLGCRALAVGTDGEDGISGAMRIAELTKVSHLDAVVCAGANISDIRKALAEREGPIVPLLAEEDFEQWLIFERHVCIDTTAAGGNAALLGG